MGKQFQNQKPVEQKQIKEAINVECVTCGCTFATANFNEKECLSCKVTREMHLPEDTIVNHNVLNIYMAGKYDRERGVDPVYLKIAEGVALLERNRPNEQLCTNITFFGEKNNEEIEDYVVALLDGKKHKDEYDALVFVKVTSVSGFMVFGISWSDRMINKLSSYDTRFRKNYAISLAINWYYGERQKHNK